MVDGGPSSRSKEPLLEAEDIHLIEPPRGAVAVV